MKNEQSQINKVAWLGYLVFPWFSEEFTLCETFLILGRIHCIITCPRKYDENNLLIGHKLAFSNHQSPKITRTLRLSRIQHMLLWSLQNKGIIGQLTQQLLKPKDRAWHIQSWKQLNFFWPYKLFKKKLVLYYTEFWL